MLAAPVAADEGARVAPGAFEAEVTGRTLHFGRADGSAHGAEQYLPGRRVIWQSPEGDCLRGKWRAEGADLCFAYEDRPGLWQCWEVRRGPGGLSARVAGAGPGDDLRVTAVTDRPLVCDGADRPV